MGQRRYLEGEKIYRRLAALEKDEKLYRSTLFDITSYTRPALYGHGGWAKEQEKDQITGKWVASIRYQYEKGMSTSLSVIDSAFQLKGHILIQNSLPIVRHHTI